jgi:coenzyme F420-reducing hydrogenase gamma subunit
MAHRPLKLAFWKLASCDGCHLVLIDFEDQLADIAAVFHIAYFPEVSRRLIRGPYDVSLVEGSVATPEARDQVHRIRERSRQVIALGACACGGGIQALRNFADARGMAAAVYPRPEAVAMLADATPLAAHIAVDAELHGCPVDRSQLLNLFSALVFGRTLRTPGHSLCVECKRRGIACLIVTRAEPCLGPVTRAGCGALCPAHRRGCFGCFGPHPSANFQAMDRVLERLDPQGVSSVDTMRRFYGAALGADAKRGVP